jgi:hypothetical protein
MTKKCSFLIFSHPFTKLALNKTLLKVGEQKSFQKKIKALVCFQGSRGLVLVEPMGLEPTTSTVPW